MNQEIVLFPDNSSEMPTSRLPPATIVSVEVGFLKDLEEKIHVINWPISRKEYQKCLQHYIRKTELSILEFGLVPGRNRMRRLLGY